MATLDGQDQRQVFIYRLVPLRCVTFYLAVALTAIPLGLAATGDTVSHLCQAAVLGLGGAAALLRPRVTLTCADVIRRDLLTRSARRSDVAAVHVGRRLVKFVNNSGEPVLIAVSGWTRQQLLEMGEVLNVPVYDYRTWFGLGQADRGQPLLPDSQIR
jgi:hypothetical protein